MPTIRIALALCLGMVLSGAGVAGQDRGVDDALLREVLPGASRFSEKKGSPPVWEGFAESEAGGGEVLLGYAFVTSDFSPRETGYDGPIESLVGMNLEGILTGVRVLRYNESHRRTRGDFLRIPGFQEQFAGKSVTDPFRIRRDVDNISGATITVQAMTRAVRNASRQVAQAYLGEATADSGPVSLEELGWLDWVERGLMDRVVGTERGLVRLEVYLAPLLEAEVGPLLLGGVYDEALARLGERGEGKQLWMIGIDGSMEALFRGSDLRAIQDGDTIRWVHADLALVRDPRGGKADGQVRSAGLMAIDPALDPNRPFVWRMDVGGLGPWTAQHSPEGWQLWAQSQAAVVASEPLPSAGVEGARAGAADPVPQAELPSRGISEAQAESATADATDQTPPSQRLDLVLDLGEEEASTLFRRTLDNTSWGQFAVMVLALLLASGAFFTKIPWLRPVSLTVTVLALGWGGVGFLSVSHITSGLKVGPAVYAESLTLFALVAFTAVTTVFWGRVFCGYLCPFGALQDFLDWVVPDRWRRNWPHPVGGKAQWLKYGILGAVVLLAIFWEERSIYPYVEPFGTVFFLSRSKVLWAVALSFITASVVIPRFYCRYICPLGASLAIVSWVSPFRIRRVPQCSVCTVCEQTCPTGAIQGEKIDFPECVRCNACELKLKEKAGVCRHEMEKVTKLIQLKVPNTKGAAHVG